ncbi:MAG: flagellar biosynthetic protein FlhB [Gammaproteobacteria bacterium SG8_47]|nr:MAG: flagellar biosynthetic protein FlhB [Gammaproteobacteria bacterium SG8_47]
MAENENGQERTEEATPRKRQKAREKGQVPRSREFNSMLVLLAAAGAVWSIGPSMFAGLAEVVADGLSISRADAFSIQAIGERFEQSMGNALLALAPFFAVVVAASIIASVSIGGLGFSLKSMAFSLDKLNPISGIKRIFAWRGLVELLKALAKFVLIGGVLSAYLTFAAEPLLALGNEPVSQAIGHTGELLALGFLALSSSLILVALIDVPFQLWDHARNLRMTRQDVKDEHKETDGSPETKSRVRSAQRELSQRRMMAAVPEADVVVTNPQHYAVALRYDAARMAAPVVVAKGSDLIAAQIRNIALEYNVPLVAAPPLARALYHTTELEQEVPAGLYVAVAQVLAYVFQLKRSPSRRWQRDNLELHDLPIPDDMQY